MSFEDGPFIITFQHHLLRAARNVQGAAGLPFNGQFPVARITSPLFEAEVGLPPLINEQIKRDYGIFVLLNTLAPEYECPSCKYHFWLR